MRVLVLCDGGGSIGVGHVMRSLALAEEAVAAGHEVVVAGSFEGSFLARQLGAAPVEVVRFEADVPGVGPDPLLELIQRFRPDVVHVDSYEQQGWLMGSFTQSNMEDSSFGRRPAEVVIDPTLGAELTTRPDDGSRWLLRGSRYTPVGRRVTDARRRRDEEIAGLGDGMAGDTNNGADGADQIAEGGVAEGGVARSVLVVMGGTDPMGLAPAAVDLLTRTGLVLDVTVIAVGENADRVREAAAGSLSTLHVLAPVDDLPALMSRQDLVISAAGTSVWELCCIGVPMAVIWTVDNQREGYHRVVAAGAAVGLGGPDLGSQMSPDGRATPGLASDAQGGDSAVVGLLRRALTDSATRARLVRAGRQVVDGLGAWRVVQTWGMARRQAPGLRPPRPRPEGGAADLVARPATLHDARLLWQWRNDPDTLAGSRSPAEVPWEDHLHWLTATLSRSDRLLLVVQDVTDPADSLGTARWDLRTEGEWEVSVTVAPERRGQSLARSVLSAAEAALTRATSSRVARSEAALTEATPSRVARSPVTRPSGADVTAYLAVVHIGNAASLALFETSGYLPDLPPDARGFMRFRKAARVP